MASETSPARISIYDAAAANRWRTALLVVAFTAIIAVLGYFVGEYFYPGGGLAVLPFALALSLGSAFTSYFAGDRIVLAQSQARELAPTEQSELHNVVATIAVAALGRPTLTPIIATLIRLAVSRQREYLADASGALLTRYPPGLASALRKIAADREVLEVANKATASLYIANPLKDAPTFLDHLFDTHPPIEERIKRLEAM